MDSSERIGRPPKGMVTHRLRSTGTEECSYQLAFLQTQNYLPRGGTTHRGLGPLTSVIEQENAHRLNYLKEKFSQLRGFLVREL